jgi:hypothetical protein
MVAVEELLTEPDRIYVPCAPRGKYRTVSFAPFGVSGLVRDLALNATLRSVGEDI